MTIASSGPHDTTSSPVAQSTVHRILFVITDLDYGGAETQVRDIALAFRTRGLSVGVVSMLPPVAYQDDLLRDSSVVTEHEPQAAGPEDGLASSAHCASVRTRRRP
jgi:hypothetical protein